MKQANTINPHAPWESIIDSIREGKKEYDKTHCKPLDELERITRAEYENYKHIGISFREWWAVMDIANKLLK